MDGEENRPETLIICCSFIRSCELPYPECTSTAGIYWGGVIDGHTETKRQARLPYSRPDGLSLGFQNYVHVMRDVVQYIFEHV